MTLGGDAMNIPNLDEDVQRAILLKAIMEALSKSSGMMQAEYHDDLDNDIKVAFTRYNARPEILRKGLSAYIPKVRDQLATHGKALPTDGLWKAVVDFALDGVSPEPTEERLPAALSSLDLWSKKHWRDRTLAEMGGSWWVFRPATKRGTDDREVTVSFLNIRPSHFYDRQPSEWMEFALFIPPKEDHDPHPKIEGICLPHADQLHFLGLLDRTPQYSLPATMVLHYVSGGQKTGVRHRVKTNGLVYVTNKEGKQVGAPITAFFIEGSQHWTGRRTRTWRVSVSSGQAGSRTSCRRRNMKR